MKMQKKTSNCLAYITAVLLLLGLVLGLTVRADVWNTRNVINQDYPLFIGFGGAALVSAILYCFLEKKRCHRLVLFTVTLVIGACSMLALAAMWYDCVVEIAYIYGEGNLELGNQPAVIGSVVMFVSSAAYVLSAVTTICLSARK